MVCVVVAFSFRMAACVGTVYVERGDTTLAQALLSEVQSRLDKGSEYHGFVGALAYRQNRTRKRLMRILLQSRLAAGEGALVARTRVGV